MPTDVRAQVKAAIITTTAEAERPTLHVLAKRRSAILALISATSTWPEVVRSQRLPSCRISARSARMRSVLSSARPDGAYPSAASHLNSIIRCWMLNGSRRIVRLATSNRRDLRHRSCELAGHPGRGLVWITERAR